MIIRFLPQRNDISLQVVKAEDSLTINGETIDFSALQEGQQLPAISSDVFEYVPPPHEMIPHVLRENGELIVSIILPHGPNPPDHVAFPTDLVDVQDGPIPLPTDGV